jgi:hypothetical protein
MAGDYGSPIALKMRFGVIKGDGKWLILTDIFPIHL